MHTKIFLTKWEITQICQQASLIKGDLLRDSDLIGITIDSNQIAVEVPHAARSIPKQVSVNRAAQDRYPSDDEHPSDHC